MTKKQTDKMWNEVNTFIKGARSLNCGEGLSDKMMAASLRPIFKRYIKHMSNRQLRNLVLEYLINLHV